MSRKQIACREGLRLELLDGARGSYLSVGWDDDETHRVVAEADPIALFAVLNGARCEFIAPPWHCTLRLDGSSVEVRVTADEFEILCCKVDRSDFEEGLLRAFPTGQLA